MQTLKVVVADDHRLMVEAVRLALEDVEDIEIVGEATSGSEVLPVVGRTSPDLVLLDFRMPEMDGLTCLDRLRQRYPQVKIVMMSGAGEQSLIAAALRRGAAAFVLKSIDPQDLPSALRQTMCQTVFRTPDHSDAERGSGTDEAGLSPGELKVLRATALGRSNKEIAKELWLSDQTVKFHLRNIYRKLGVSNRTEASRYALQQGLIGDSYLEPSSAAA